MTAASCRYRFRQTTEFTRLGLKRWAHDPVPARRPSWFIRWVCRPLVVLILTGAYSGFVHGWVKTGTFSAADLLRLFFLTVLLVMGCWPGVWKWSTRWVIPGKPARTPHDDLDVEVSVSSAGLDRQDGISRTAFTWDCFTRARFYPDGILLDTGPSAFLWLPDDALFQSSRSDAEAAIRAHVTNCVVLDGAQSRPITS